MNTEQLLEAAQTIRTIQLMLGESSNEWLPLIAAIGGAFVGGTFASITPVISGWAQRRNERRTITSALLSEIDSILYILEKRGYVEARVWTWSEFLLPTIFQRKAAQSPTSNIALSYIYLYNIR